MNDAFGECDQSSLNRFVTMADFDLEALNNLRLEQVNQSLDLQRGMLIIDESLSHHTGRKMELAGLHRSGVTKQVEWGHNLVNSFFVDAAGNEFPVRTAVYVREQDCKERTFKTKRELGIEHLDAAIAAGLPISVINADAGYEGVEFTRAIMERDKDFIIGVRVTTKVSRNRNKRVSIDDISQSVKFNNIIINNNTYAYHIETVNLRGIGRVKLVLVRRPDEEEIRAYITSLVEDDKTILTLLIKRWRIECFHREAKQHVGLESYQVRKGRGMQVVALAILTAYTLALLATRILKTPGRALRSIGEACRYLQLIAYKGVSWIRQKKKDIIQFKTMLERLVFIKTAKA